MLAKWPVTFVDEFFVCSGSGSFCLDNNPNVSVHEPSIFHKKLPGQIVNATLQCSLQFGIEFYACPQKTVSQLLRYGHIFVILKYSNVIWRKKLVIVYKKSPVEVAVLSVCDAGYGC